LLRVQVKYLLGVSVPRQDAVHEQLKTLLNALEDFRWREYVMGVSMLLLLVLFKRISSYSKRLAWLRALGPLTVSALGIILVASANIDEFDEINTIKKIPAGAQQRRGRWTPACARPASPVLPRASCGATCGGIS
jgi:sulfate transporter 4